MWLRDPVPNQPSPRVRLNAVLRRTQSMFNRLSNTGKAWDVDEVTLSVNTNQGEYPLNVDSSFGKPLAVTTLWPGQPNHIPRDVEFFQVGNMNFNQEIPDNLASGLVGVDGSNCTAQRIAFLRKDGLADNVFVRVSPIPQQPAQYSILYSIGNWIDTAAITSSPVLTEHHQLPEVQASIDLLPSSDWWVGDEKANRGRRAELADSLNFTVRAFEDDFAKYIRTMTQGKMRMREMYGYLD